MADQSPTQWLESEEQAAASEWNDPERRLQHQVEIQSRQIEQVLSRHQVPAGVSGGSVRPHWVSFDLASQLSGGWDKLRRLTGEVASALGVPEVRLERLNGSLRLAVKRNEPHPVDLLDLLDLIPEAGELSLALGLDHQGQPVMLDLNQSDLHNILIAGVSGAGKSSLMRSIAISLALTCRQSLAQMAVIGLGSAPSGITTRPNPLYPVNYLPHLLFPVATEVDEAVEALAYLVEEVAYRAENHINSPALVIIIDDTDMLLRRVGGAVAEQVAALLHAPAEAGVRVIVGASNPGLPDLWQMLQHNADLRLVGRMADERLAQAATGLEKSYAQYLDGKGDFIALSEAAIEPFQAAYIDDYDLHLTLTELHRLSAPVLLAQSINDEPALPPSWSNSGDRGFIYDASHERVELEPDDRSGLSTVEIAVDPFEADEKSSQHLTWLDDANGNSVPGGLGLPLYQQEPGYGPEASEIDGDPRTGADGSAARAEVTDPVEEVSPAIEVAGPPFPAQSLLPAAEAAPVVSSDEIHEPIGEPPASEPTASGEGTSGDVTSREVASEDGGDYEMLPFDDGRPDEQTELVREPDPSATEALSSESPATEVGSAALAQEGGRQQEARRQGDAPSKASQVRAEQAQTLWSVEPIYTDVDDDLWDAPDGDEDWRKRLH